jgi:hypothetical protein
LQPEYHVIAITDSSAQFAKSLSADSLLIRFTRSNKRVDVEFEGHAQRPQANSGADVPPAQAIARGMRDDPPSMTDRGYRGVHRQATNIRFPLGSVRVLHALQLGARTHAVLFEIHAEIAEGENLEDRGHVRACLGIRRRSKDGGLHRL